MSTPDFFATVAPEFDRPAVPRMEFASALWIRLEAELHPAPRAVRRPRRSWLAFIARRPRRMVLVAAILLLLLSGVATATYLGVHDWVSGRARGVQVTSDFRLSTVYATHGSNPTWYWATALSADGHDLYLSDSSHVYRVSGVDSANPERPALLADLWDAPGAAVYNVAWQGLAPSPGGDLFVLANRGLIKSGASDDPLSTSVLVIHRDGSRQVVVTYRELARRGLLPAHVPGPHGLQARRPEDAGFSIASPAPDRLILLAHLTRGAAAANAAPFPATEYMIEVDDPNGDGDWGDRVIRRIELPRSVPGFHDSDRGYWWYRQPVAESSLAGDDRSRSVLLAASWEGERSTGSGPETFRVYRVGDENGDGDALDSGEANLLYSRASIAGASSPSWLAERVDRSGGRPRRELVMTGGVHGDRIAVVGEDGEATDIGRSFPGGFTDIHAAPNGDVYVVVSGAGSSGKQTRVYRLTRGTNSARPARELQPEPVRVPPAGAAPLLLVSPVAATPTSYWIRPDGSHVSSASHAQSVCGASGGGAVAFTSDLTVPREPFVYLSTAGSSVARKVTERPLLPICPFDGRHLVLASAVYAINVEMWTLETYDLRTQRFGRLVATTPRFAISPDGRRVAYVLRRKTGDRLLFVNLRTLRRHRVALPPLAGRVVPTGSQSSGRNLEAVDLVWSPDAKRLAVVSGREVRPPDSGRQSYDRVLPPQRYAVTLVTPEGRRAARSTTVVGDSPTIEWSPDGTRLLVCAMDRVASSPYGGARGCDGVGAVTGSGVETLSVLHVVSATDPSRGRLVTHGTVVFAGWSPRGVFAWADYSDLHLPGGRTVPLDSYGGEWVGWSPDGRYLVQGPDEGYRVVDLKTGRRWKLTWRGPALASIRWWR